MIVLKHASERIVQAISRIALLEWGQHGVGPDGRWRWYDYDELVARDKTNLNTSWLRDVSVDDAASPVDPDVIAAEAIEDLQTALDEISLFYADLAGPNGSAVGP